MKLGKVLVIAGLAIGGGIGAVYLLSRKGEASGQTCTYHLTARLGDLTISQTLIVDPSSSLAQAVDNLKADGYTNISTSLISCSPPA